MSASLVLADETGTPVVATNDVHYHTPERRPLQDVMTAIRHKTTVAEAGYLLHANAERHLKPAEEMARLFEGYEDALARTQEIAERCTFSLDELRYEYPDEISPDGCPPQQRLAELTWYLYMSGTSTDQKLARETAEYCRRSLAIVTQQAGIRQLLERAEQALE